MSNIPSLPPSCICIGFTKFQDSKQNIYFIEKIKNGFTLLKKECIKPSTCMERLDTNKIQNYGTLIESENKKILHIELEKLVAIGIEVDQKKFRSKNNTYVKVWNGNNFKSVADIFRLLRLNAKVKNSKAPQTQSLTSISNFNLLKKLEKSKLIRETELKNKEIKLLKKKNKINKNKAKAFQQIADTKEQELKLKKNQLKEKLKLSDLTQNHPDNSKSSGTSEDDPGFPFLPMALILTGLAAYAAIRHRQNWNIPSH